MNVLNHFFKIIIAKDMNELSKRKKTGMSNQQQIPVFIRINYHENN